MRAPLAARRFRPGPVLPAAELRDARAAASTARASRWKASRSPAPGSTASSGLVSTIVLEMGGSSDLCALLKPGEPVVLMGPTGTPTEIAAGRDGGARRRRARQRGAVLDRAGVARARARRCSTSPATRSMIDRYKVAEIEAAADVVVWCCDEAPGFAPTRPQDRAFVGNIVQAMARVRERASWASRRSRSPTPTASSRSAPTA